MRYSTLWKWISVPLVTAVIAMTIMSSPASADDDDISLYQERENGPGNVGNGSFDDWNNTYCNGTAMISASDYDHNNGNGIEAALFITFNEETWHWVETVRVWESEAFHYKCLPDLPGGRHVKLQVWQYAGNKKWDRMVGIGESCDTTC